MESTDRTKGSSAGAPSRSPDAEGAAEAPRLLPRLVERYRENDAVWMLYHLLERGSARVGADGLKQRFWQRANARELAHSLPGTNTRSANRTVWDNYDWSDEGEEWSVSSEWRDSLIEELMLPTIPPDAIALEIGPGAGRWSLALQGACRELHLADVSERAIELCREKLGGFDNVAFHVTDGASIPEVGDSSIDFVWSFDVFVHIAPADQASYLRELARVMRPGARGVIHHAGRGGVHPDAWRSSMTAEKFAGAAESAGLRVLEQRDSWGADGGFTVPTAGDVITVFER